MSYVLPLPTLPLRGTVAASWGSPAEEELLDTISFDDWLQPNKDSSFLIKISSDAMVDAGIHPDDVVIVERGRKVTENAIVVAVLDRQWVIRYYQLENGQPVLLPANGRYASLYPQDTLEIIGVVVACIRKYN